jgi:L-amino acid N-acyltransferase
MNREGITIRRARPNDLSRVVEIYNQGVEDGVATCDLSGFTPEERKEWFYGHVDPYPLWVATRGEHVIGWTNLSRYDSKPCFHRTATFATYVDRSERGKGVGSILRQHLIEEARALGFHTIVNRVWSPNQRSIELAKKFGFQEVGRMRELVFKDGEYVDCVFFQLILDKS